MDYHYLSEKGYLKLRDEIERLEKLVKRDTAKEIAAAAAHGDLKENAEYAAAKEKQAFFANKLRELQRLFSGANVVRKAEILPETAVTFGKQVKIEEVKTGDEQIFTLLGEGESDPDEGIISYTSPMARALIGNKQGDVVDVQLPIGMKTFKILEVTFCEEYRD
jgi:transcription elongation factor GreA